MWQSLIDVIKVFPIQDGNEVKCQVMVHFAPCPGVDEYSEDGDFTCMVCFRVPDKDKKVRSECGKEKIKSVHLVKGRSAATFFAVEQHQVWQQICRDRAADTFSKEELAEMFEQDRKLEINF